MSRSYEGDIVRPLGLVTLHFGYAEAEIDGLLESLSEPEPLDDAKRQWPVGRKLAHAIKLIDALGSDELAEFRQLLENAAELFDKRNALVHSAIFAKTKVVASRASGREQPVSAEALTELAKQIFSCKEHINAKRQRLLEPMLVELRRISGVG